jgi:CysZ protein
LVGISPVRDFVTGVGLLGRGFGMYARSPALMVFGMLPALIAFVILATAYLALILFIGDIAPAVTWFAGSWPTGWRDVVRVVAAIAVLGLGGLLAVVMYVGLTLTIGDPWYEKISERVDAAAGGVVGAVALPWWRELRRSFSESVRLLVLSAVIGSVLFVAEFLPVVGQSVVPVIGAAVGGWALAIELTGVAFARRGMNLAQRRRVLRGRRWLTLGFGMAAFVFFLVPLVGVVLMPAAVAGATLLTRQVVDSPELAAQVVDSPG